MLVWTKWNEIVKHWESLMVERLDKMRKTCVLAMIFPSSRFPQSLHIMLIKVSLKCKLPPGWVHLGTITYVCLTNEDYPLFFIFCHFDSSFPFSWTEIRERKRESERGKKKSRAFVMCLILVHSIGLFYDFAVSTCNGKFYVEFKVRSFIFEWSSLRLENLFFFFS